MAVVEKSVLIGHSAQDMYKLVTQVDDYPKFLPWCGGTEVLESSNDRMVATLKINFKGIRQQFTTENVNTPTSRIQMTLKDGPFKHLDGVWEFIPLMDDACKIQFKLHYEFSSKLLEGLIGPVFSHIANTFVDSFVKRADQVYIK